MRSGQWTNAWTICDTVLQARQGDNFWHLPRHEQPVWDGTPLDGKRVLIRCYHGLGDTIQFIRFAPLVKQVATDVIVWAQPALIPLLCSARGIDQLLPLHDGAPEVAYDADVEIMELPHVFRITPETLPAEVPYLHVQPASLAHDGNLQVGIVWEAGDWDPQRNVPLTQIARLAALEGITLHALQRGPALADWPPEWGPVSGSGDVLRAAQVMRALDLVITVDSMPAHLAGALGVPVWTLLHADADWRWMDGRDDTPWYPTMRLFRQEGAGDWEAVIERIAAEALTLRDTNGLVAPVEAPVP